MRRQVRSIEAFIWRSYTGERIYTVFVRFVQMGYCQLFVNGLIHIAMLPLLILSWLVLAVTRYSRFTGARLPWATLPSVVGGFCSEE